MKLTKLQRLQAYKYALEEWESKEGIQFNDGLCLTLEDWLGDHFSWSGFNAMGHFPELLALKPKKAGDYWWKAGNAAPRIKALKKAIIAASPVKKK